MEGHPAQVRRGVFDVFYNSVKVIQCLGLRVRPDVGTKWSPSTVLLGSPTRRRSGDRVGIGIGTFTVRRSERSTHPRSPRRDVPMVSKPGLSGSV